MSQSEELERQLSELLTEGEIRENEAKKRERLSPKYEVRVQTQMDPIVEETRKYRKMARELDDRYDEYMSKADKSKATDQR
ncbi:hypothetical protein L8C07_22215 [Paenibacillus sp. CMAA1739]|uniref:Uncharacterized protein n=1 Tax=Paenibacillus ottowii TaxID=2315729 RepID=A0ABY3B1W5_9BACL|nr:MULTISPECIES: hypothetical protein [Paenibacillus]KZE71503.1 hypothetical protein AV545_18185 [Paenibacillus jamilae]MDP1512689.1 hypothetical protein [Paenibacillus ottowii]MEC4568670.1 hypothetical protein [Paenibacillus sp. CMAA1739]NEU24744.1 hypothetical protein [Paenibacillus polymyxa]OBA05090.1 hypothetical protein A9P44_14940 [Paenibacillus polymyxa]